MQFLPLLLGCLFRTMSWKHINSNVILGSFRDILPKKSKNEKSDQEKSQKASEGEEQGRDNMVESVKKKRKQRGESVEDGEQPGPSCPQTPPRRTKRKISYCEFFSPISSSVLRAWMNRSYAIIIIKKTHIPVHGCLSLIQKRSVNKQCNVNIRVHIFISQLPP